MIVCYRRLKSETLKSLWIDFLTPLPQIWKIHTIFPGIKYLELASNNLRFLSPPARSPVFCALESLNLASNCFEDWEQLALVLIFLNRWVQHFGRRLRLRHYLDATLVSGPFPSQRTGSSIFDHLLGPIHRQISRV